MERITDKDLKLAEERANDAIAQTSGLRLKVSKRYDYVAIDFMTKDGRVIDTFVAGLKKREAFELLSCISRLLCYMRRYG